MEWLDTLKRKDYIEELCVKASKAFRARTTSRQTHFVRGEASHGKALEGSFGDVSSKIFAQPQMRLGGFC